MKKKIYLPFKYFFDFIFAFIAIILLSWLFIIIFIIEKCSSKGPAIFKQERIGKDNKPFNIYKFRSLRNDVDHDMCAINVDNMDQYCTKFGKFLRKTSLDEIPQLFNILQCKMSFIGPRPLINKGADAVTIQRRNENGSIHLRPGISGLAQIHKREKADSELKSQEDFIYYQNISLLLDIKIFFKTIFKVFLAVHQIGDNV